VPEEIASRNKPYRGVNRSGSKSFDPLSRHERKEQKMMAIDNKMRHMRRARVTLLAMAAALLFATGVTLLADSEAKAQARFRTVTKTFSNQAAIQIPSLGAANLYPSAIKVETLRRAKVLDANLTLRNYSHSFSPDVDVLLVGPRGQKAFVMSDVGNFVGQPTSDVTFTLNDEAKLLLPEFSAITNGGSFRPNNGGSSFDSDAFPSPAPAPGLNSRLSVFDGTNPRGAWQLFIVDDTGGEEGQIAGGWALQIKAKVRR
jgi:hypothetical protein